jgi:hypothetical protein
VVRHARKLHFAGQFPVLTPSTVIHQAVSAITRADGDKTGGPYTKFSSRSLCTERVTQTAMPTKNSVRQYYELQQCPALQKQLTRATAHIYIHLVHVRCGIQTTAKAVLGVSFSICIRAFSDSHWKSLCCVSWLRLRKPPLSQQNVTKYTHSAVILARGANPGREV